MDMTKTNNRRHILRFLAAAAMALTLCGCSAKTAEHYGLSIDIPAGFEAAEDATAPTYISKGKEGASTVIILEGSNTEGYTPEEYAEKSAAAMSAIEGVTVSDEAVIEKIEDMDTIMLKITVERTAKETEETSDDKKSGESTAETEEKSDKDDKKDDKTEETTADDGTPGSEQWLFFYVLDGDRVVNIRAAAPVAEAEKSEKTYKKMFESVKRVKAEETTPDPYETLDTGETLPALEMHLEVSDGQLAAVMTDENGSEASRIHIGEVSVEKASPDDEIVTLPE